MSKTPLEMVKEYQDTSGQEPDPKLYEDLIDEEYEEWVGSGYYQRGTTHELKELADLVYVIYGYANSLGWNLDEALKRIHQNNMDRMYQDDGTILRREDNKIIKNPNTPKVVLEDLVK